MAVEVKVPEVGESITEVQISRWMVAPGDYVERDQPIAEIDSDKATVELPAPESGILGELLKKDGEFARVGEVIGRIEPGPAPAAATAPSEPTESRVAKNEPRIMPAARRAIAEKGLDAGEIAGSGPGGRVLKEDALRKAKTKGERQEKAAPSPTPAMTGHDREEEVLPMSPMRRRIAQRLVEAQAAAALLTTFNEVDMHAVQALRREHQEEFQRKHGVKLGFMSFFVKAVVEALKACPSINAEIRNGEDIVYRNYYDIGIAVSSGKGLVVPVLRNVERMGFGAIEQTIAELSTRARENKITLQELEGGTFTITNGGVFGSLLSTPIVNPPQSGVLGMHAVQDRPVAVNGEVVIRPMMYVALTYDHRIVDGREAVTFLRQIKERIERPARLLLEI